MSLKEEFGMIPRTDQTESRGQAILLYGLDPLSLKLTELLHPVTETMNGVCGKIERMVEFS
jgi:hypothetical protein